jgi:rubrerythrin
LDKRYVSKYGESPIENFKTINENGIEEFKSKVIEKWKCKNCGSFLCVHRKVCLICGAKNEYFPEENEETLDKK